jgi:hypothetical protein
MRSSVCALWWWVRLWFVEANGYKIEPRADLGLAILRDAIRLDRQIK